MSEPCWEGQATIAGFKHLAWEASLGDAIVSDKDPGGKPGKVRAYQLLHIFLHELGHHRDAYTRPAPGHGVRGESYAEVWAERHAELVWERYFRKAW